MKHLETKQEKPMTMKEIQEELAILDIVQEEKNEEFNSDPDKSKSMIMGNIIIQEKRKLWEQPVYQKHLHQMRCVQRMDVDWYYMSNDPSEQEAFLDEVLEDFDSWDDYIIMVAKTQPVSEIFVEKNLDKFTDYFWMKYQKLTKTYLNKLRNW